MLRSFTSCAHFIEFARSSCSAVSELLASTSKPSASVLATSSGEVKLRATSLLIRAMMSKGVLDGARKTIQGGGKGVGSLYYFRFGRPLIYAARIASSRLVYCRRIVLSLGAGPRCCALGMFTSPSLRLACRASPQQNPHPPNKSACGRRPIRHLKSSLRMDCSISLKKFHGNLLGVFSFPAPPAHP
jgi:hypothetical protein